MRGRSVRKTDLAGGGSEAAQLTRCAGTWLEQTPDAGEQQRIAEASRRLREQRRIALEFYRDPQALDIFCIELFRSDTFAPLHFADPLIERMIKAVGEPPVVDDDEQERFSDYLRTAVLTVATPNTRRFLSQQLRRMLPHYADAEQWREAVAIDYNAFRTSLGNEVSPFLAQMALAGLADYYDAREDA